MAGTATDQSLTFMMLPMSAPTSRCSHHLPVIYVWAEGAGEVTDIEAAVNSLMGTLRGAGRQWNPYSESMARAEFRQRLLTAELGDLVPVDEVLRLVTGGDGWLYEIRWQDISVRRVQPNGSVEYYDAQVRALHGEPPRLPQYLIGVHVHEKLHWSDDDSRTEDEQNAQIRIAVKKFWAFEPSNWGIA